MPILKNYRLTKETLIPRKFRLVRSTELAHFLQIKRNDVLGHKAAGRIEYATNLDGNPLPGQYDLWDASRAIITYERERRNAKPTDGITRRMELAKYQQVRARVERETLQNQIFFTNLFRKDDVVKEWNDTMLAVRSKLMTLPWLLGQKVLGRENFQEVVLLIQAEMEKMLIDLSEMDEDKVNKILERDRKTSTVRNSLKAGQFPDPTDVRRVTPSSRAIGGKIQRS